MQFLLLSLASGVLEFARQISMLRSTLVTADSANLEFWYVLTSRADAVHVLVFISLRSLNSRASYTQQGSPEFLRNLGLLQGPLAIAKACTANKSTESQLSNARLDGLKWHNHK